MAENINGPVKIFGQDLTGKRFHRLLCVSFRERDSKRVPWWNCVCDCGGSIVARSYSLTAGVSKSCGCLKREILSRHRTLPPEEILKRNSEELLRPPKRCCRCGEVKPRDEFYRTTISGNGRIFSYPACKICWCLATKKHKKENPLAHKQADDLYRCISRYGMTPAEVEAKKKAQNYCCAICLQPAKVLNVDHCHKTGAVRGILCFGCNSGIGKLGDDPAIVLRAHEYLLAHSPAQKENSFASE